jgi:predicted AlkP superfamily phosphohydrolase/phosphomutase
MMGGDGTAEQRVLEIIAHDTELLKSGTRFALEHWDPEVLFHYSPMTDAAGHRWVGVLDPTSPAHDPEIAEKLWPFYTQVFQLTDSWLGEIVELAGDDAVIALVTDHGMMGTAYDLHINYILKQAGLLRRTAEGEIDLAHTRILSAESSFFLRVNDRRWRGGIVPEEERDAVIEEAAAALLAARHPETGQRLVERVWRRHELVEKGLDHGPGGDLYFQPAAGYYPQRRISDHLITPQPPGGSGGHGFWPDDRLMQAIFYLAGPGVRRGAKVPPIRHIDIAPTLAHLLGIPAPAQAEGRVVTEALEEP